MKRQWIRKVNYCTISLSIAGLIGLKFGWNYSILLLALILGFYVPWKIVFFPICGFIIAAAIFSQKVIGLHLKHVFAGPDELFYRNGADVCFSLAATLIGGVLMQATFRQQKHTNKPAALE